MESTNKIEGLSIWENLYPDSEELLKKLISSVEWNESIQARKTASFGKPYNYSGIEYPEIDMSSELDFICVLIEMQTGWRPNNCLMNYYEDGNNTMGWNFDRTDIENKENKISFETVSGDMVYMANEVQDKWHHSIPKSDADEPRISLTFRKIL